MIAQPTPPAIVYPDSDGQPMAENTLQFRWIVTLKENLEELFRGDPAVFVAGDNLIYPVEGQVEIRQAPDVYVAFGRPKGDRGSYKVWEEGGVFPQVVFEVRSPGNRAGELARKLAFYDQYGAEEYYLYDPDRNRLTGYVRTAGGLDDVPEMNGFRSPRLGIRFDTSGDELAVYGPGDRRFQPMSAVFARAEAAEAQAEHAVQQARQAKQEADRAKQEAGQAKQEADRLRALLRAAGIDPDRPPAG